LPERAKKKEEFTEKNREFTNVLPRDKRRPNCPTTADQRSNWSKDERKTISSPLIFTGTEAGKTQRKAI